MSSKSIREAAEEAAEYLESINLMGNPGVRALSANLRAALAQKQPEPVAWMFPSDLERFKTNETNATAYSVEVGSPEEHHSTPLYTSAQTPSKRLSSNDICPLIYKHFGNDAGSTGAFDKGMAFAAAIQDAIQGEPK